MKGYAKTLSPLGTSRTARTRDGGPTEMLAKVGNLRGHGPASALRILLGGMRRLGGNSDNSWSNWNEW